MLAVGWVGDAAGDAPAWENVAGREMVLFTPGQSSWEWALTESDHSGGAKIRKGKSCQGCHADEEVDIAVSEDGPGAALRPTLALEVKFARDAERLYVRLAWPAVEPSGAKLDPDYEARATLMFDDGAVKAAKVGGCWGACHDDLTGMASAAEGAELTKYLTGSRARLTRSGGGESFKPAAELDKQLGKGAFLEYWQAQLNRGQPAVAASGRVLEQRSENDAPDVSAEASLVDGKWVVVLSRRLVLGKAGRKDIVPGKRYTVGFAIHENHTHRRFHHVSLEHTFSLDDAAADFVAKGS